MSLRDSETAALAAAAHALQPAAHAEAVTAAQYAFATRVLRVRPASRLVILARGGIASVPTKPVVPAQAIVVSLLKPGAGATVSWLRASLAQLPLKSGSIDALAEFTPSDALTIEADEEALGVLNELGRILRSGGRYLCGGAPSIATGPPRASADKRRLEDWRYEGRDLVHHTLQLVRPDGSWRRLHERVRLRSVPQSEALLKRADFDVLNAFDGYAQRSAQAGANGAILLCERR